MACGKGRLIHSDGDVYEGDWKNDKAHGHVLFYWKFNIGKIYSHGWCIIYRLMGGW